MQFPCVKLFSRGRADPERVRHHRGQRPHAGHDPRRRLGAGRLLPARRAALPGALPQARRRARCAQAIRASARLRRGDGAARAGEAAAGRLRGRGLDRRRRALRRPDLLQGQGDRHRRRVHRRLHRHLAAGPRAGQLLLDRARLGRADGLQGADRSAHPGQRGLLPADEDRLPGRDGLHRQARRRRSRPTGTR